MGREKPTVRKPYLSPYSLQLQELQRAGAIPSTPLLETITEAERRAIAKTGPGIEPRIDLLRNAIINAMSSLTYNPYEQIVKKSIESMVKGMTEPFEMAKEAFGKKMPEATFRTAGAAIALPPPASLTVERLAGITPKETEVAKKYPFEMEAILSMRKPELKRAMSKEQYEALLPTYRQAFESVRDFLETTRKTLSELGLTPEEIQKAMSPYITPLREGLASSLQMGGVVLPEYSEFVTEWGLV